MNNVMRYQQNPQGQGYPPQQGGYPPQQGGYPPPGSNPYGYQGPPPQSSRANPFAGLVGIIGAGIALVAFFVLADIDFNRFFDKLIDSPLLTASDRAEARRELNQLGMDFEITGMEFTEVIYEIRTMEEVMGGTGMGLGTPQVEAGLLDYLIALIPLGTGFGVLASLVTITGNGNRAMWTLTLMLCLGALAHLGYQFIDLQSDLGDIPGFDISATDFLGMGYWAMVGGIGLLTVASIMGLSSTNRQPVYYAPPGGGYGYR